MWVWVLHKPEPMKLLQECDSAICEEELNLFELIFEV